jgi:hypothetical protein
MECAESVHRPLIRDELKSLQVLDELMALDLRQTESLFHATPDATSRVVQARCPSWRYAITTSQ